MNYTRGSAACAGVQRGSGAVGAAGRARGARGTHGCCSGTAEARSPVETFAAREALLLSERARPVAACEVGAEALAIIVKVVGVAAKACEGACRCGEPSLVVRFRPISLSCS